MADEAKLCSPIHSTFKVLGLCDVQVGVGMENWALMLTSASCRHCTSQCITSIC